MTRNLRIIFLPFIFASLMIPHFVFSQPKAKALELETGPHLFLDDYLIAEQSFLNRTVNQPQKLPEPIITGGKNGDDVFQPYMSVLRDPDTGRYRIWYGTPENVSQSHIGYLESEDGIHWIRPHRVLDDPGTIRFGVTVLDRGVEFPDSEQRYLYAYYLKDGLRLATSADGLEWKTLTDTSVLRHNHDINDLYWDPIRKHYVSVFSVWRENPEWGGDKQRLPHQSVSADLINWEKPWMIIAPKVGAPIEVGEMQFYSMSGIIQRGDLLIGLVKVLRDDLNATPGKSAVDMGDMDRKAAGLGYTVLAWTRDGRTWQRDHEPFLPNDPIPGSWDHAMVWGDEQIIVGDETFLYYGGYARGHKVARFDERQIGLARMPRDRYVAREADLNWGHLITRSVILKGQAMTVNAKVVGEMRLRLLNQKGEPLAGYEWIEIKGDRIDYPISWKKSIQSLKGKAVRLEFQMRNAQLFGFDLN